MSPSPTKDKSKSDKRKKDGEEGSGGGEKEDKSPPSKQSKQAESPVKAATKTDSTRCSILNFIILYLILNAEYFYYLIYLNNIINKPLKRLDMGLKL